MKLYFCVLCSRTREIARGAMDPARTFAKTSGPAPPCLKRMLMIANDSGEMAVVVESNGILYEAIIDPLS